MEKRTKRKDTLSNVRKSIYYSSGMYYRDVISYEGPDLPDVPLPKWFKN